MRSPQRDVLRGCDGGAGRAPALLLGLVLLVAGLLAGRTAAAHGSPHEAPGFDGAAGEIRPLAADVQGFRAPATPGLHAVAPGSDVRNGPSPSSERFRGPGEPVPPHGRALSIRPPARAPFATPPLYCILRSYRL